MPQVNAWRSVNPSATERTVVRMVAEANAVSARMDLSVGTMVFATKTRVFPTALKTHAVPMAAVAIAEFALNPRSAALLRDVGGSAVRWGLAEP